MTKAQTNKLAETISDAISECEHYIAKWGKENPVALMHEITFHEGMLYSLKHIKSEMDKDENNTFPKGKKKTKKNNTLALS